MNTPKYNIEQEIKKQINEREISPTRDLWSEIETQTSSQTSSKSKINWFLLAACLTLFFSLGFLLVFNQEEIPPTQMAETNIQPENIQSEKNSRTEISPLLVEKTEIVSSKSRNNTSSKTIEIAKPEVVIVKTEIPLNNERQEKIVPELYKNQISNNIATIDSVKTPIKKKRFVDPSTLLFSVEHKDMIEKSKDGSNVATIDLNSK